MVRAPTDAAHQLIRPMWPGAFPHIARNLFNVVLVMDLGQPETCRFLAESVLPTVPRIGLRWGLVPGGLEGDDETCECGPLPA